MKRLLYQIIPLIITLLCSTGCLRLLLGDSDNKPTPFEAVDLGLPSGVLWASQNLDADRPWDVGERYAWGAKDPYNPNIRNYPFIVDGSLTGYNYDEGSGVVDNRYILDPEDDVATVKLGADWRMPTKWEFDELRDNCIWESSKHYGITGFTITSKVNSNSIFLPAYQARGILRIDYYDYWTSCLNYQYNDPFKAFEFDPSEKSHHICERSYCWFIRPVMARRASVEGVALKESKMSFPAGKTKKLRVDFTPADALDKRITWSSDDDSVAYIDENGNLTALFPGETRITAFSEALSQSAVTDVTVEDFIVPKKVDLGLPSGALWADRDLGAIEEDDLGLKFAWGAIRPTTDYNDPNYVGVGYDPDYKLLTSDHDAATVILGPGWRTPGPAYFRELAENCEVSFDRSTSIFTLVSKTNGNKLHLSSGAYWTSSKTHIFGLVVTTGSNVEPRFQTSYISVAQGFLVRPVFDESMLNQE